MPEWYVSRQECGRVSLHLQELHKETGFLDGDQADTGDTLVLAGKGLTSFSNFYYGKGRLEDRRRYKYKKTYKMVSEAKLSSRRL